MLLCRKGRLKMADDFAIWLDDALNTVPLNEAPMSFEVARTLAVISLPHADPADLFLAASAKAFGLTLVTSDRNLLRAQGISVMEN